MDKQPTPPASDAPPCSAFRTRVLAIARAAIGNPRFEVQQFEDSIHVTLDGWDVATLNDNSGGMNSTNMQLAESILNLSQNANNPSAI